LPEFEESVELNPDSDAAGVNLGNALAAKGGHLEEALQQLNKGIELQPESASAQNGLESRWPRRADWRMPWYTWTRRLS
jgi:tetratricopeptide (TPR) repeat protein